MNHVFVLFSFVNVMYIPQPKLSCNLDCNSIFVHLPSISALLSELFPRAELSRLSHGWLVLCGREGQLKREREIILGDLTE